MVYVSVTTTAKLFLFLFNSAITVIATNENVDIKFSAHDVFLELPASGTLKIERFESQII
jgi:hypothetical protein